jgi:Lrp/AsnC family leucine-responsive transcriptional regulator
MTSYESQALLDETAMRILEELQTDGRMTMAELGRRVALSAPAVAERVKRLEEAGIIKGYRAVVDPARLGYGLTAIVRMAPHVTERTTLDSLQASIGRLPEVLECWHTVGDDCFFMRVVLRDARHLECFLEEMMRLGKTSTAIVLSTTVEGRAVKPLVG